MGIRCTAGPRTGVSSASGWPVSKGSVVTNRYSAPITFSVCSSTETLNWACVPALIKRRRTLVDGGKTSSKGRVFWVQVDPTGANEQL